VRDRLASRDVKSAVVLWALDFVTINETLCEVRPAVCAESIDREICVILRPHDRHPTTVNLNFNHVAALDLIRTHGVAPAVFCHDTDRGIIDV
jgi:hypothetical protein